jgi:hypothetical protein
VQGLKMSETSNDNIDPQFLQQLLVKQLIQNNWQKQCALSLNKKNQVDNSKK